MIRSTKKYLLVFPRYLVSSMTKSAAAAVDERLFTSRTEELLSSSKKTSKKRSIAMSVSTADFATPDTTFGVAAQRIEDFEDESLESTK